MKLVFFGEPTPKQSARFRAFKKGDNTIVSSYQTKSVKDREKSIMLDAKSQISNSHVLYNKAIGVKVLFVFKPLKSWSKKKIKLLESGYTIYKETKPDLPDNLMKGVFDALEGVVFTNDSRVAKVESKKIYGFQPRTEVEFYELQTP